MSTNKDLTIHLKIKTLRVPVPERLPVIVIWSRQSKQAKTKKRLLSDQVDTTVFDEEFQISTTMACDEAGNPTQPKMVSITACQITYHLIVSFSLFACYSPIWPLPVIKHVEFSVNVILTWLSSAMRISNCTVSTSTSASTPAPGSKSASKLPPPHAAPPETNSIKALAQIWPMCKLPRPLKPIQAWLRRTIANYLTNLPIRKSKKGRSKAKNWKRLTNCNSDMTSCRLISKMPKFPRLEPIRKWNKRRTSSLTWKTKSRPKQSNWRKRMQPLIRAWWICETGRVRLRSSSRNMWEWKRSCKWLSD